MIEDIDRDVFVRIQTDLLVIGDSIMTDRHHASNGLQRVGLTPDTASENCG